MAWKNPWYNPDYPHHLPDGFCNVEPDLRQSGDVKRWRRERKANGLPLPPQAGYAAFINQWWRPAQLDEAGDGVWWLGHATLLLRLHGRYLLTDPVFSTRASPLQFLGPQRKTPPALALEHLPPLDAVLISHNHYDHLDLHSVRAIHRRFPDACFYVPLGLGRWFRQHGIRNVRERDWWQGASADKFTFTAVPARHWSMRTLWDRNRSLWCGWVIESPALRFWFCGDSGESRLLATIGQRLGPLDAAAIPIGAFEPRWFMANHHMGPQEAVTLWRDIGRPLAVPIHWGAFELADESLDTPPRELMAQLKHDNERETLFFPRRMGEFVSLVRNK